eukprot:scaffold88981_cov32-Tisochrysis_lutea.AAC.4
MPIPNQVGIALARARMYFTRLIPQHADVQQAVQPTCMKTAASLARDSDPYLDAFRSGLDDATEERASEASLPSSMASIEDPGRMPSASVEKMSRS